MNKEIECNKRMEELWGETDRVRSETTRERMKINTLMKESRKDKRIESARNERERKKSEK